MKQTTTIQRKAKSQNRNSIKDAVDGVYFKFLQTPVMVKFTAPSKGYREALNIFLIQNKGKGPPGGRVSPGEGYGPEPDNETAADLGRKKIKFQISNFKFQLPNFNYQISNFYSQLNF